MLRGNDVETYNGTFLVRSSRGAFLRQKQIVALFKKYVIM